MMPAERIQPYVEQAVIHSLGRWQSVDFWWYEYLDHPNDVSYAHQLSLTLPCRSLA